MRVVERRPNGEERVREATPAEVAADSAQRQRAAITELAASRHWRERHWQADLTDEETVAVVSAALHTPTTRAGPGGAFTTIVRADDELVLWLHPFGTSKGV